MKQYKVYYEIRRTDSENILIQLKEVLYLRVTF